MEISAYEFCLVILLDNSSSCSPWFTGHLTQLTFCTFKRSELLFPRPLDSFYASGFSPFESSLTEDERYLTIRAFLDLRIPIVDSEDSSHKAKRKSPRVDGASARIRLKFR